MKKLKNNGFTLAELLIVVAIIGVLVAIAIPIYSNSLEASREATDLSNVRSAYAKVMAAVNLQDHHPVNADGVVYNNGRWYINVQLNQEVYGWQTSDDIVIGGVSPKDKLQWQGEPTPGGMCTVSYTPQYGAVFSWEYNFAPIVSDVKATSGEYAGMTVAQLFKVKNFPMLESSGGAGRDLTNDIKHQLGLNDSDKFAYKILPKKNEKNTYELYISTERDLVTNGKGKTGNFGTITVTGYIYKIDEKSGASTLIEKGTTQQISTYTNGSGQEKMDVYGDQNGLKLTTTSTAYSWK